MVKKHLHVYKRHPKRNDIYVCIHPDCTHYANKSFLFGKRALCAICLQEYIITNAALRLKTPHCGCRGLTDQQRERLAAFGTDPEQQEIMALDILKAKLMEGL